MAKLSFDLTLTERERAVLILILSVDLDALGVERKDQAPARAILRRLKADKHIGVHPKRWNCTKACQH